ncbi:UNVERIFIED_CONTAM: hypothetical protein PYX00_008842 [Menopon gallinae]|uniref:N-acetylglucosaminylphosphatidylinositol deacetylase n=1 Tax=Menopon gallinae TaxID=328185 RepID=A0AAW2H962_9NEOP
MKTKLVRQIGEIRKCKNILFVTSHPDDECMFFGPSIITLTKKPGANVYLLCLSRGDYRKTGRVRKEELYCSCKILGIPESNVQIVNSSLLPDNPMVNWNEEVVAQIILNFIEVYSIDTVITFDKYGVSNHRNHTSVFYAVAYLCLEKQLPKDCTPYALESVSKLRKYVSYFDLPLSFLLSSIKYVVPMEMREVIRSAMRAHKSQYVWFRKAYMLFSRYVFINTLKEIDVLELELELEKENR